MWKLPIVYSEAFGCSRTLPTKEPPGQRRLGFRLCGWPGAFRERILTTAVSIVVNLIVRRDETAAMRSQANTAKLLQDNPTLMRLRELEVLEKVAASAKLNVVIGEKGLTERVVNML